MRDFHRRIINEVHTFARDAKFEVLRSRVHVVMQVTFQGKIHKVTMANTPRDEAIAVVRTVRELKRKLLNESNQGA